MSGVSHNPVIQRKLLNGRKVLKEGIQERMWVGNKSTLLCYTYLITIICR